MCDHRFRPQGPDFGQDFRHSGDYRRYDEGGRGDYRGRYENIYRPSNMIAPFPRRFVSNAEFLAFLKDYLKDLQQETQAVKEAIAELEEAMAPDQTEE